MCASRRVRRVALVHWKIPPTVGGVESSLVDLAAVARWLGYETAVISGEREPTETLFPSVELHYSPALDVQLISSGNTSRGDFLQHLGKLVGSLRPDIVHAHNLDQFWLGPLTALTALREKYRYRLCHTFHLPKSMPGATNHLVRWDSHHAVSTFIARHVQSGVGIIPTVSHLPVDTSRFAPRRSPLTDDAVSILHPGRMCPGKGFLYSIVMLRALVENGVPAKLVVTDPRSIVDWTRTHEPYRRTVARAARELGVANRITVVHADWSMMPSLYNDADIVVHPSALKESLGMVPLEAMSCERPLVCSGRGAVMETVIDGVTALVCDVARPASMLQHVRTLVADRATARAMGQAARRHVQHNFGLSRFGSVLEGLYEGRTTGLPYPRSSLPASRSTRGREERTFTRRSRTQLDGQDQPGLGDPDPPAPAGRPTIPT